MRPSPALKPISAPRFPDGIGPTRSLAGRAAVTLILGLIGAYKALLSPLFGGGCRFEPSCSEYFAQAVATHGAPRGLWLGLRRLARCNPFGGWGIDPCPPRAFHAHPRRHP